LEAEARELCHGDEAIDGDVPAGAAASMIATLFIER
jgi:hypothetical protein